MNISEKVVYITGGSKGIGFYTAKALLAEGAKVAISSRAIESANAAAELLATENVLTIQSNVTSYEDEQNAVTKIIDKWGKLDVLIANAGVGHFASIEDLTIDQWDDVIDTNLTGVFHSVKAAVDEIKKSKGYIITIASLAGTNFFAKGAAYNASKFGLVGFTQAIMLDLRAYDVKVSTIMPGSVTTYFNGHTPSDSDHWKIHPSDIGQIVRDLLLMNPRTLPSKIEVRPSRPDLKK